MRLHAVVLVAAAAFAVLAARADAATTVTLRPSADLGLPFWCSWGYDSDERCYTDDGPRLPVGGVDDKVWRSALTFPLGQIAAGATVDAAVLRLWFDGVCVAPRKRSASCAPRAYGIDVRAVLSGDWLDEREVEVGEELEATATAAGPPRWLEWDVTALVERWQAGTLPNYGLLLGLTAAEEDFGVSGPYFPSMSFPDAAVRPQLVVAYS